MLRDIIEKFNNIKNLDNKIMDTYIPADGTYIIIKQNNNGELKEFSKVDIKLDKKTRDIDRTIENIELLIKLDYNSKLIDMNKPIDGKKIIHSNNYLSFFVKKDSLALDDEGERKLTNEIIENYYNILENPMIKYEKKTKSKEIYEELEKRLGKVDIEKLSKIRSWVSENIYDLDVDLSKKDYLKIFFLYDEKYFEVENERYLLPNIFNSNEFNVKISNNIFGVPNNNMGLNSKKPYLENKTRKIRVPILMNREEILLQKKIFDYFYNLACMGFNNIYVDDSVHYKRSNESIDRDFNGIYLRIKKGKELEILDFEIISAYKENLNKPFNFENILGESYDILGKNTEIEYGVKRKRGDIHKLIDEIIFSKYLINSYYAEKVSIKDEVLEQSVLLSRDKLFQWFYKGNDVGVGTILQQVSILIIKSSINKNYLIKAMNQFNLKYSLKNYFFEEEENMADIIKDIKDKLRRKISEKATNSIESDREYFFAVGQLTSYFISKSKGKSKPMSLVNPIISSKTDEKIKLKISLLFKKYNYDINLDSDLRFKNLYSMILAYKPEGKIENDLIIAGYLNSNLIYEKKEQ